MPFFELVLCTSILLKLLSLVQHVVTYDIFVHISPYTVIFSPNCHNLAPLVLTNSLRNNIYFATVEV